MTRTASLLSLAAAFSALAMRPAGAAALTLVRFLSHSPQSLVAPAMVSLTNNSLGPGPVDAISGLTKRTVS